MTALSKILVANRGEIALRVLRTAQAMGYTGVAVFSDIDADAPHVHRGDEAVALNGRDAGDTYLAIDKLIHAAKAAGADAIHPGYGFLAESADFARACAAAGIVFIGPPAEAIALMGNKRQAKQTMQQAGVPCVPGYEGDAQEPHKIAEAARSIGLPVMIKAAAGGGGKGMRRVDDESELAEAIRAAASEAKSSFGSAELIVEKAVVDARHVEVQVFADSDGNTIHLGERDCSMQRRHQKIVEESPCPAVTPELREAMGEAAVAAAKAVGYVGAGTVELLLDPDGNFYFLEMNTRLQVEHPVTELVTGYDLVAWQLCIAAGEPLPARQDDIQWQGHAIEARLYAEAPAQQFMPQTGRLLRWREPAGDGVRVDAGVAEGQTVTPHYDPLLAKIIAHGPDRDTARRRLARALRGTDALGVTTNRAFLLRALAHPEFTAGEATTAFVGRHREALTAEPASARRAALAACLLEHRAERRALGNWRNTLVAGWPCKLMLNDGGGEQEQTLRIKGTGPARYCVEIGEDRFEIALLALDDGSVRYRCGDLIASARYCLEHGRVHLADATGDLVAADATLAQPESAQAAGEGRLTAPMDGAIVEVTVTAGERVSAGQTVAVLEAMKMETLIRSDVDGTVEQLLVAQGDQVASRQLVAVVSPNDGND